MNPDPLTSDPAGLAAGFHRVADGLEALTKPGGELDKRDKALARENRVTRRLVAAVAVLLLLVAGLAAWGFVLTRQDDRQAAQNAVQAAQIKSNQAAIAADAAARKRQGAAEEKDLCASFTQLAALKPPAADSSGQSPSRTYLDRQHVILAGIGTKIGCDPPRRS